MSLDFRTHMFSLIRKICCFMATYDIATYYEIKQVWTDEYMTWNTADYGGLDEVVLPARKVWTPDVALENR